MIKINLRFYEELNDFLGAEHRKKNFMYALPINANIKDVIESLGVPHVEIDLILANSKSVNFSYQVKEGDYFSIYPLFEGMDITSVSRLRPKSLRITKFVLDVHLGKLARYLRLLGRDSVYKKMTMHNKCQVSLGNESQS